MDWSSVVVIDVLMMIVINRSSMMAMQRIVYLLMTMMDKIDDIVRLCRRSRVTFRLCRSRVTFHKHLSSINWLYRSIISTDKFAFEISSSSQSYYIIFRDSDRIQKYMPRYNLSTGRSSQ